MIGSELEMSLQAFSASVTFAEPSESKYKPGPYDSLAVVDLTFNEDQKGALKTNTSIPAKMDRITKTVAALLIVLCRAFNQDFLP